ncbi:MAG: insulinase family protein [Clostridia bacterium]|nr:insulinase family protein [Clostridia bacterium]
MNIITKENGLRIFYDQRPDSRSATVGIWVASGSENENESNNGISHFIEHILFKGSKSRTGFEIAEGMDEIGASYNAYTTKEYTYFYVKALDYQLIKAADLLFDLFKNPRLDENDIETEKGVILEEIAMCEDDPSEKCFDVAEKGIYEGNGLAFEILGTGETVSKMKKEDFLSYIGAYYVPERTVIGVSGNFDREEIDVKIAEYFDGDRNTSNPIKVNKAPFTPDVRTLTKDVEQTHILMSFKGIPAQHEDLYPLQICSFILGLGPSSMLGRRIREELGLVYGIESFLVRFAGGGTIEISMSLAPASEEKAIRESLKIIAKLADSVTERQVTIAKEKLAASFIMSREQPQSKFSATGYNLLLLNREITDDEIIEAVRSVTLDDVKRVAREYFKIPEMSFTAVGKVSEKEKYRKIISEFVKEGE